MSATVKYKGQTLGTVSNTTKKLTTKGMYCEDDIEITDSGGGGSANLETLHLNITPSTSSQSWTETPSQGYDGFDEVEVSVDAMPAGSVTAPATITGTNADKFLGSGRLALQKAVNVTPVVSTPGYVSEGTAGESTVLLASDIDVESAQDYHPSTQDQTISANKYLYGAQKFKAVVLANLLAENIKSGVTVKVGDDTDDDCVTAVTGTYEGGGGTGYTRYKTGTFTPPQTYNTAGNRAITTISALGFTPSKFIMAPTALSGISGVQYAIVGAAYEAVGDPVHYRRTYTRYQNTSGSLGQAGNTTNWTTRADGHFYLSNGTIYYRTVSNCILVGGVEYSWYAYE